MAGHKSVKVLFDKLSPESRARIDAKVREMEAEMLLAELRKLADLTQAEVAASLGISQPEISRLEGQDDMQISTLAKLVRALGGELEISVKLPNGRVKLAQFSPS
jgi:transcriptional regulator with XRE-family HTH domain